MSILLAYKYGSGRMGLESSHYAVRGLMWLGIHASMLSEAEDSCFQALTSRDKAMMPKLRSALSHHAAWTAELDEMERCGVKADIEALYTVHGLSGVRDMLARKVMQRDYIQ